MVQVEATETLARYIYSRNHYRTSDNTVKYSAFIPPENKCLSVFRISGLREDEIWGIGGNLRIQPLLVVIWMRIRRLCGIGGNLRTQPLLGRADIKAAAVNETGLSIDADDTPPRHVNIIGWPDEDLAIKLKALELAEEAELRLK